MSKGLCVLVPASARWGPESAATAVAAQKRLRLIVAVAGFMNLLRLIFKIIDDPENLPDSSYTRPID
jgi:hypothetical protein